LAKANVDLIIKNANQLITLQGHSEEPAAGSKMGEIGILRNGAVAVNGDRIVAVGETNQVLEGYIGSLEIDASNKVVIPGFIDSHTHLVFAGSREDELDLKIKGASYMEIMQRGGGILRTVRETRSATQEQLVETCRKRVENLIVHGTTTAEAKSGYGLTLEDEIKSLETIQRLNEETAITLIPTFLGAHAIPPEFQGRTAQFVTLLCETWIPEVARRKLAVFCDVFCEKGVFEIEDSRRILESAKRAGLLPKLHADELYPLGGAELAAEVGAVSADHLLFASTSGLAAMRLAGVVATLLPAAPLTLMLDRYADARKIIAQGVPVALGSDLNPGCWLENFQLVIALACYKLRMTPAEALTAATINAAHAVRSGHLVGSIEVGKKADLLILEAPDYRFLANRFGSNMVGTVVKNGRVVAKNGQLAS